MILEAKNITFQTKDGRKIVDSINLDVANKKSVGIIGMNGCGKTTLLKCLANLYEEATGDIHFLEKNIKEYSKKELAQKMAMMHQVNYFPFDFTVREIVEMGRYPFNEGKLNQSSEDVQYIESVMNLLQLNDKKQALFSTLSGGEKQRVLLARALAQTPELLILDEPTNHLDVYQQKLLLSLIKDLNITTLSVLHDLNLAYEFCDEIYMLKSGTVKYHGKTSDVMTEDTIKEVFNIDVALVTSPESKKKHIVIL